MIQEPGPASIRFAELARLCHAKGYTLELEAGCAVMYEGLLYQLLAVEREKAALVDGMAEIPFRDEDVCYVEKWRDDPEFIPCPGVETLLRLIWEITSLYPTLVPGIDAGKEAWRVQHPAHADSFIYPSPQEALVELAIALLQKQ